MLFCSISDIFGYHTTLLLKMQETGKTKRFPVSPLSAYAILSDNEERYRFKTAA